MYDVTPASRALGLRGKVLEGRHFKLNLWDPSHPGSGRAKAAASACFSGGSRKAGAGSAKRRGKSGFAKKKRGR